MSIVPEYLILGEILRPHGIRGELRMKILTDYPERIPRLNAIGLGAYPDEGEITFYKVQAMRMHKGYGLLKLENIDYRDQAEPFRGLKVLIRVDEAVPLEDDEVYLYQLIGMAVTTDTGKNLGAITDVLETGANDVYVVNGDEFGEVLIPVTHETILETNTDSRIVTVNLPEGLIPEL